jgi:hypothetical protein
MKVIRSVDARNLDRERSKASLSSVTETRTVRRLVEEFDYEAFRKIVEPMGYRTVESQRDFLGTTESTFWRARNSAVSDAFVGLTLRALPQLRYADLFRRREVDVEIEITAIEDAATVGV